MTLTSTATIAEWGATIVAIPDTFEPVASLRAVQCRPSGRLRFKAKILFAQPGNLAKVLPPNQKGYRLVILFWVVDHVVEECHHLQEVPANEWLNNILWASGNV